MYVNTKYTLTVLPLNIRAPLFLQNEKNKNLTLGHTLVNVTTNYDNK